MGPTGSREVLAGCLQSPSTSLAAPRSQIATDVPSFLKRK